MLKNILVILSVIVAAQCTGELKVLKSPKSVKFIDGKFTANNAGQLFQAAMGYSTYILNENDLSYNLEITEPFFLSEYLIELRVSGVPSIGDKVKSVATIGLTGEQVSLNSLKAALGADNQQIGSIDLNLGTEAQRDLNEFCDVVKPNNVKTTEKSNEIKGCQQAANVLSAAKQCSKSAPTLLEFNLDLNNLDKSQRQTCLDLVLPAFEKFVEQFTQADKRRGIVAVIAEDAPVHSRPRRATDNKTDLNLAVEYNENYPVIFNIILWFGVLMVFSLLAISYAIGGMDPGRDSIIYRMTSTRIKKDN